MTPASKGPHGQGQVYPYRLPSWLGLLLLVPLGLFLLSIVVALALAGAAPALILPLLLRRTVREVRGDDDAIELRPEDYRRID